MTEGNTDNEGRQPSFSQRYGYAPFETTIQVESLNDRARTDLWNFVVYPSLLAYGNEVSAEVIWTGFFAKALDSYTNAKYSTVLKQLVFEQDWYSVYDLIEYVGSVYPFYSKPEYTKLVNHVLTLNRAGYRIIDEKIAPISHAVEIEAVEAAIDSPFETASSHIRRALALFAVRDNPNFAKVIQEAMSAAEAAAQIFAGTPGAVFGDAVTSIQKGGDAFHPALAEGWKRIYGFTSDSGGIRHALKEGSVEPDLALAQYFLVTCSAFVNLVVALVAGRDL